MLRSIKEDHESVNGIDKFGKNLCQVMMPLFERNNKCCKIFSLKENL